MRMPTLRRRWTVSDLQDLPDDGNRYEIIDGQLFVTPAPSLRHQEAVGAMYVLLRAYLGRERIGSVFGSPVDVAFSDQRAVQPDLCVMPLHNRRRPERFEDVGRLLLAVEVLSPTTARADRVDKRVLFRDEGVAEYWIVDLDARTIERSTPIDPRIEVLVDRLEWMPDGAASPLVIDLLDYFATVLDG